MKKLYAFIIIIVCISAGCGPYVEFQPTSLPPDPNLSIQATQTAAGLAYELNLAGIQAAATSETIRALQTGTASAITLAAGELAYTQAAQALEATQSAAAVETERAWMIYGWTATADTSNATATAQVQATASAISVPLTAAAATRSAILDDARARSTVQALADADQKRALEIEQRRLMNLVWAVTRWLIPVCVVLLALWMGYTWARSQRVKWSVIRRDERGDAPLIPIAGRLVDMDLSGHPVIDPHGPHLEWDQQRQVTENAMKVRLAKALPPGDSRRLLSGEEPVYQVVAPGEKPPPALLLGADASILDADWKDP